MNNFAIQLVASLVGTLGFGILFKVHPKKLPIVALLGGGCYALYFLFASVLHTNVFVAAIAATAFVSATAELLSRVMRAPTIIFIIPSIIPIVPGGALYKFMKELIHGNSAGAGGYGKEAILTALGVAGGIIVVSIIANVAMGIIERIKEKSKNEG